MPSEILDDKNVSKDDILDILNEDNVEEKVKGDEEVKGEEEEEKEVEEETEDEEELEIEDEDEEEVVEEEKLELVTPARKKDILKAYPDLFKKFPHLEVAYYRDKQFTELLGTVDDAKEVIEKANAFDNLEGKITSGDTAEVLKKIKDTDVNTFNKVVDTYLETLATVDKDSYFHVVGSVINRAIVGMVNEAKRLGEENGEPLANAAAVLNHFIFGTSEYKPTPKLSKEDKGESDTLKKEREEFIRERFETAQVELSGKIDNKIKSTIDQHIDKNSQMTSYVKRNAIRDAMGALEETLANDKIFKSTVLDKLWKKAAEERFSRTSLDRIESAYLSKAKTLLPSIISKARAEALKGLGKSNREEKDRRGPLPQGRSASSSNNSGKVKEIPKGMRTIDFLNSD